MSDTAPPPPINGMNRLVDDTIHLQMESISTQSTTSTMGNQVTQENQTLTTAWNSCTESNAPSASSPGDPAYEAWYYLQCAIQGQCPPTTNGKPNGAGEVNYTPPTNQLSDTVIAGFTNAATTQNQSQKNANIDAWVDLFLGGNSTGVSESCMSSYFLVEVYNAYENSSPASTDTTLGLINSVSSWVTSAGASDEKSGQNEITLTNTLAQHFISDQNPLSNIGSSVVDTANNYASAMQQISP